MRFSQRLKRVFGSWKHNIFGMISRSEFETARQGPVPQLLDIALKMGKGTAILTRLSQRKPMVPTVVANEIDRVLSAMGRETSDGSVGYELNGIQIPCMVVNPLTMWAIELYGDRVVLAPHAGAVFKIWSHEPRAEQIWGPVPPTVGTPDGPDVR